MMSELISDYWHQLHSKQSDWAFRAYSRLVQTLSEDVQEKLRLREDVAEPYVVIFGKTQVGKTTLLLDLMGIDPAQMRKISKIMRGGRASGKSATATAMEYCGSSNEEWGLSIQSTTYWFNTDEEVTHELGLLREKMESSRLIADSPCVVHIPKRFFGKTDTAPKVRILDLPGDNPANEEEQKHVNHMAKTYLPFADLILLVGRGDDLGFLRPDVLTLPGIEDWQAMPHRFRIVTTYSYTAQSVKDILRSNPTSDTSTLRQRLIQEIERFGVMSEGAKDEKLYFPLEFGASWMTVKENDQVLHQRMTPIISQLRSELLNQISLATTPMGRLRSTLNTHLSVKYIQQKKADAIEIQLNKLAVKKNLLKEEIKVWEKAVQRAQCKYSKIEKILDSQEIRDGRLLIEKAARNLNFNSLFGYAPKNTDTPKNCQVLRALIQHYYDVLQKMHLDLRPNNITEYTKQYWNQVRQQTPEPDINSVRDILDDAFGAIRRKIADYNIDRYFFTQNYEKDQSSVFNSRENATNELIQLQKQLWLTAFDRVNIQHQIEQLVSFNDEITNSEELKNAIAYKKNINDEESNNRNALEHVVRTSQEDLERCDRFVHLLDEEYLTTLSQRIDSAVHSNDDCDSLLQLFSCIDLKYQHEHLMELNKKNIN